MNGGLFLTYSPTLPALRRDGAAIIKCDIRRRVCDSEVTVSVMQAVSL